MAFRCAAASLSRDEPLTGTASTVRAFLLLEDPGPWGVDALRDARLHGPGRERLVQRAESACVRVLLVRRHRGADPRPGVRVFAAWADPAAPWLETATFAEPELVEDLDVAALGRGVSPGLTRTEESLFAVCTHGRHDACCAELGRPTAAALAAAHPQQTWEISHIGGDRFAANVLVLPHGLYYGRVQPEAVALLAEQHLAGHLDPDRLRGRSGFGFAVQVAEVALRRQLGETRLDGVRLLRTQTAGEETGTIWSVDETSYDVRVRRTLGAPHQLTCRALRDNPAPAFDVVSISAT